MGYSEGAHDAPADTKDRLVRVGSKYQATPPSVADGDNAYLLLDAAGRALISCAAAHDAAALGNPLRNGDVYILRWPASVERATLIQAARIWTRAADFEPFFVDADVDTDVRILLEPYRKLAT